MAGGPGRDRRSGCSLVLPHWAFAWGRGLVIAHDLAEHADAVAGRRFFDVGSGSGLRAIAASGLNAEANGVRVGVVGRDVLDHEPPDVDIILASDWAYEAGMAIRVLPWLRKAGERGIEVLVGDPGRRYLPLADLVEVAIYEVRPRPSSRTSPSARRPCIDWTLAPKPRPGP
ncbi:MAG: methyltransferase [Candidatus Limnocylindrales bacterium]